MRSMYLLPALLLAAICQAQPTLRPAPADLPGDEVANQILRDDPAVREAAYALEAARERAQGLNAGPHEWTARTSVQRRRDRTVNASSTEWMVGLERGVRIAGKAGIDQELGEAQIRLAQGKFGEARHEAARDLLTLWLDWTTAERTRRLWQEQARFAQDSFNAATKRRNAGDASLLEQNAARADLAEVQRQLATATNDEGKARAKLRVRFPTLQPLLSTLPDPQALEGDPAQWRERILSESDVLRSARAQVEIAELQASRARADRVPDPTLGVFTSSERSGAERIVGVSFSMPIGGAARQAQERENLKQLEGARAATERQQREAEADIALDLTDLAGSLERWRFAEQSLAASQDNARLAQRGYSLGEVDLQTLLLARRQGVEAALGAEQARVDALRARYRLYIDAHLIWGLQDD